MYLTPCLRPSGTLEPAPSTSLRPGPAGEQVEGFWLVEDERYYVRALSADGAERWYRIADTPPVRRRRGMRRTNVLPFPSAGGGGRMMVGRYRGRAMIVGTSRRGRSGGAR